MCPKLVGCVAVRLKTTAEASAGTPETPATWNERVAFELNGVLERVSIKRAGPAGTNAPGTAGVPLFFWSGLSLIVGVGYTLSATACWLFGSQARLQGAAS